MIMKNFRTTFSILACAAALLSFAGSARAETAIFAGGCFWCVESDMDALKGVTSTVSGYAGGTTANPTYESHKGYTEAVEVKFDPKIIGYDELVARFLRTIDVVDGDGQFCDRGSSYIPAIFVTSEAQAKSAKKAIKNAEKALGQKLQVPVLKDANFGRGEDYHQDYYLGQNRVLTRFGLIKQADAYKRYRKGCGRDVRVKELWGKEAYTAGKADGAS
jgi:peptide-methionine (S)-S-oxide reductase